MDYETFIKRTYHFVNLGFRLVVKSNDNSLLLKIYYDNPSYDSDNNIHKYSSKITEESMSSIGISLNRFLDLLEIASENEGEYNLDFTEKREPKRMIMDLYEVESGNTLVSLSLYPDTY